MPVTSGNRLVKVTLKGIAVCIMCEESQSATGIAATIAHVFLRNELSLFLLGEPLFSLLEPRQSSSKLFAQFCSKATFVDNQLVPFDPELTHTYEETSLQPPDVSGPD